MVTIYEIFDSTDAPARALYSYLGAANRPVRRCMPHDYPGIPVASGTVKRRHEVLDGIRIPLRPHFGDRGGAAR